MPKELPYFKWYPADALSDIDYASMDLAEIGLYHMCLNYSWVNDGLPTDPLALAKLLRIDRRQFQRLWTKVSRKFPEISGRLRNERQELERDFAKLKSLKATESIKARYERTTSTIENVAPRALARADYASVSDSSVSLKGVQGETKSKLNGHGAQWSERLYSRHPKKKDRTLVEHALFSVMQDADDPQALFAEIDRAHALWCADFSWIEHNGRFAPTLARWLDDRGWTQIPKPNISKEEYDLDEYDRRNGKI